MATEASEASERSTDFMLEEFRFLKVSFEGVMTWKNERFKNYINIIFGTAALLAVIAQIARTSSELFLSVIAITAVLYLYGLFVFTRLVAGIFGIEQYRRAINRVRKYFVDKDQNIQAYLLVPVDDAKPASLKRQLGSGLLGTTALTNSLLLLIWCTTLCSGLIGWQLLPSAILGLTLSLVNWFVHATYYRGRVDAFESRQ